MTKTWGKIIKEETAARRNLMIVDALNLSFRWKHRGINDFAADYLRTINSLGKSYNAVDVIMVADKSFSSFRNDILETYKGDRKEKFKDQTDEEKEQARLFFEGYEDALKLTEMNHSVLRYKNVEADDLAAYLVKELKGEYDNIWLISTDRDWDLLLDENVHRFSYGSRKEFTLENFYEEHGCDTPEEYISLKTLMGDSGDSVPGIDGLGPKRSYNLIRQYGSAIDIYEMIPLDGKQKFIQKINESGDLIIKNTELMDLLSFCEDAIAHPEPANLGHIQEFVETVKAELKDKLAVAAEAAEEFEYEL